VKKLCGIDEAGRGAFAGPLVVAGVVLEKDILGLDDSKKLSEKKREALFEEIIQNSKYKIIFVDNNFIDKNGLSLSLKNSITTIKNEFSDCRVLIDGNTNFGVEGVEFLIKADSSIKEVSAASILAKVSRDRYMKNLSNEYDKYEFAKHKGYGTKRHKELIKKYGYSNLHRLSFKIKF